jgi:hypothetical protein
VILAGLDPDLVSGGMTTRAHVFVLVLTVASLAFIVRLVRRRQLRAKFSLLWLSLGIGLVAMAAFPGLLEDVSEEVGIFYPPAAFLAMAVAFLFVLVVHFSWELSRLEERTRTLAEDNAILAERLRRLEEPGQEVP